MMSKPRRRLLTRQLLLKTSVASVLIAVVGFFVVYAAVLVLSPASSLAGFDAGVDLSASRGLLASGGGGHGGVSQLGKAASSAVGKGSSGWSQGHHKLRLLWSGRGRSRFHSRFVESPGRSLPSWTADWGYKRLTDNMVLKPSCSGHEHLLILITSAPQNTLQRKVIRETWCRQKVVENTEQPQAAWKCFFLLGETRDQRLNEAVVQEAHERGDMLVGGFSDSYRNLTYKVLTGFHWAVNECHPKFILKTDDDCFVNTKILIDVLQGDDIGDLSRLYVGKVFLETKVLKVIRDPDSKWAVSRSDYAPDFYPKYASGTGYLLSLQVAQRLLKASESYNPFPNEDAYIGVLAESINVSPTHSHRFTSVSSHWTFCNFLYLLVVHHVSLHEQVEYLAKADKASLKCSGQEVYKTWN